MEAIDNIVEPMVASDPAAGESSQRQSSSRSSQRLMTVNFMPSRQVPYSTLRHRRNTSEHNMLLDETDGLEGNDDDNNDDKRAEIIVKELEQQRHLMDDTPLSEELRREALRDLPQGLTMKRNVRAKLSASVSLRSKRRPISFYKRTKYRISFTWKRTRERVRDALFSIELWYEAIRNIEGHFGSAVGSYFRMLRKLFILNLALSILLICFLVIPQDIYDRKVRGTSNATEERNYYTVADAILGGDSIQMTVMLYGHYGTKAVGAGLAYSMPFAYFFTMFSLYLVFFAVLCYRTADSYRRNFIETAGGLNQVFANKIFCGWDFGIVSAQAAQLNARNIYNELKELLNERNNKSVNTSFWSKLCQTMANVAVTSLVLATIGGILYGAWRLMDRFSYWQLAVSVVLASCVGLCPVLFNLAGRLEYYTARVALYVALARAWLLQVALLMLLFVFWSYSGNSCWESRFGQQVYRLVLLDAFASIVVLPAIDVFRALLYKYHPAGDPPEFNIAYNSLSLIYNQSCLWFGMMFSPLLPAVITIKFLILFYVKRECAIRTCQPARKVWRAAQTQTVVFMLVTLSLFITLFGIGSVFLRMSSHHCGPFREYSHVFAVFSSGVLHLEDNHTLRAVLSWLYRPGVLAFAVLVLCVLVYYARARARAQQSMVALLRHMLVLHAKDKDFLLTAIDKVSNGEWLYSPKADDEAPDTHTVRYLREVRKPSNSSYHFDASRLSRGDKQYGRPQSLAERNTDGDTDSSFSWQGSSHDLNNSQ